MAEEQHDQFWNLQELRRAVGRRKSWLILPIVVCLTVAAVLAYTLPAEYEARATVVVEGQVLPQDLARTTVTASTETRYGNLRLEILTRDNLSAVIDEFELFPGAQAVPREELVEQLRDRIAIAPLPPAIVDPRKPIELDSFAISFRWPEPTQAAAVTNRLTRDFVAANLKARTSVAQDASDFIATELSKARSEISEVAKQISTYKEEHLDELPEQLPINRQRLEMSRRALAESEAKLQAADSQIAQLRRAIGELRTASVSTEENPVLRKQALELHLNALLSQGMTDKHPDVVLTRSEIAALEGVIEQSETMPGPMSREELALRDELRNYGVESQVRRREIERYRVEMAEYIRRIESTPKRAAELSHLEATYQNLNEAIRGLQLKKVEADMGRAIELADKGERFRIVESAAVPTSPVRPNRPLIGVAGLGLGLMLGFGLLALREMADHSFHSVKDVQNTLGLPVLAAVPVIELPSDRVGRRAWFGRWGRNAAALLLATGLTQLAVGWSAVPSDPGGERVASRSVDV